MSARSANSFDGGNRRPSRETDWMTPDASFFEPSLAMCALRGKSASKVSVSRNRLRNSRLADLGSRRSRASRRRPRPSPARRAGPRRSQATSASTAAGAPRGLDLDAAVGQVSHPARDAETPRLVRRRGAEADALHAAPHDRHAPASGLNPQLGRRPTRPADPRPSARRSRRPGRAAPAGAGRPSMAAARTRTAPSGDAAGASSQRPSGEMSGRPTRAGLATITVAASSESRRRRSRVPPPARRAAAAKNTVLRSGGKRIAAPLASGSARPTPSAHGRRRLADLDQSSARVDADQRLRIARQAHRRAAASAAGRSRGCAACRPRAPRACRRPARTRRRTRMLSRISGATASDAGHAAWPGGARSSIAT